MWYCVLLCCVGFVLGQNWTDPVNTAKGQIRGLFAADGHYSMYLGIPFGQVDPKNPFGISTPYPNFDSMFDADDDSSVCPQSGFGPTSIDCLHLNVYVPNNIQNKLPVLVWIYGGGFTHGFAGRFFYGPKFLVRHNIIFVSLNYRVGPYGFMCLDTEEVPGNQGLRDQYLALKWVNENIAAFGGDVDKITVMGESAGSMSLDLHLMSEMPKFYNQAILQSGSGLTPMVVIPSDSTVAVRIAQHLGYIANNVSDALSHLASVPSESVITATTELAIPLTVCVEKEFPNIERFISVHPELHGGGHVSNMSILAGFNRYEQLGLQLDNYVQQTTNTFFYEFINQQFDADKIDSMVDKVRRFYIGDEKISEEVIWELINYSSDFVFNFPIQRSIIQYLEAGANVYQYMFSYDGERNYLKKLTNIQREGAAHADELGYLFDMAMFWETPTVEDQLIIDRMTTMWTNFVKYGNPTPTTSEVIPIIWPRASEDVVSYVDIDTNFTVATRPYHSRMLFWDLFLVANQENLRAKLNQTSSSSLHTLSVVLAMFMFFNTLFIC